MITFRFPLRQLTEYSYDNYHRDLRERLLKTIESLEGISDSTEFFEESDSIRICPNCFCPNMESFFAVAYGSKGFWCPACGNSFEMGIPLPLDHEYMAPGYALGP